MSKEGFDTVKGLSIRGKNKSKKEMYKEPKEISKSKL